MAVHVRLDYSRKDLIVFIIAIKAFGFPSVMIGKDGFYTAGASKHGRKGSCRGNGKQLAITHTVSSDGILNLFADVEPEKRRQYQRIIVIRGKRTFGTRQVCGAAVVRIVFAMCSHKSIESWPP